MEPLLSYDEFRTGYEFADIFWMIRSPSDDSRDWPKGISRHTVLGKWREIKLEMYAEYKRAYHEYHEEVPF